MVVWSWHVGLALSAFVAPTLLASVTPNSSVLFRYSAVPSLIDLVLAVNSSCAVSNPVRDRALLAILPSNESKSSSVCIA